MTDADIIEFAVCWSEDVTLCTIKSFETHKGEAHIHLCAYIKELSGIIIQCENWDEKELLKKTEAMYSMFRDFTQERLNISLPKKLKYTIQYMEADEWFKH